VRRASAVALLIAATLVSAACAGRPRRPVRLPPTPVEAGDLSEGIASWYGPGFHGKKTASGERFDQDAMTAAHCCVPLGTRLRVTLLSTGKSVDVRVNDRMPRNKKGRVIDLSRGAARRIGLIGPGTGRVRMEVLS
jgi:rare lipoprotein A